MLSSYIHKDIHIKCPIKCRVCVFGVIVRNSGGVFSHGCEPRFRLGQREASPRPGAERVRGERASHEKIIQQSDCSDRCCVDACLPRLPEPLVPSPCLAVIEKSSLSVFSPSPPPHSLQCVLKNRKGNSGKRPPNVINFLGVGG